MKAEPVSFFFYWVWKLLSLQKQDFQIGSRWANCPFKIPDILISAVCGVQYVLVQYAMNLEEWTCGTLLQAFMVCDITFYGLFFAWSSLSWMSFLEVCEMKRTLNDAHAFGKIKYWKLFGLTWQSRMTDVQQLQLQAPKALFEKSNSSCSKLLLDSSRLYLPKRNFHPKSAAGLGCVHWLRYWNVFWIHGLATLWQTVHQSSSRLPKSSYCKKPLVHCLQQPLPTLRWSSFDNCKSSFKQNSSTELC